MDRQVDSIEQASDDVLFTQVLKHSNKVIQELHEQIDYDEITIAKQLQQEGKMRNDELNQLLDDDDDDLREELEKIEA